MLFDSIDLLALFGVYAGIIFQHHEGALLHRKLADSSDSKSAGYGKQVDMLGAPRAE